MTALGPPLIPAPRCADWGSGTRLWSSVRLFIEDSIPAAAVAETAVEVVGATAPGRDDAPVLVAYARLDASLDEEEYELLIPPLGDVLIRAGSPHAVLHAAHTLRAWCQSRGDGAVDTGRIRDRPAFRHRGLFVESFPGTDLMELNDWRTLLRRMSALKLNVLGLSVYGCWDLRHDQRRAEYLMVPISGFPELRTPQRLRRWDPQARAATELDYLPQMFAEDSFADVVAEAARYGIEVIPFFAGPAHTSMLPRVLPRVSAKDETGQPTGYGYCLTGDEAVAGLKAVITAFLDQHVAPTNIRRVGVQGDEFFPIRNLDPLDRDRVVSPYCRCPTCRELSPADLLLRYFALWRDLLRARGLGVVHWQDSLVREHALDRLAQELADATPGEVTISWWGYNDPLPEPTPNRRWRTWVTPSTGLISTLLPQDLTLNIAQWIDTAARVGADGILAYTTLPASSGRNVAALADAAWGGDRHERTAFARRWARQVSRAHAVLIERAEDIAGSVLGSYPLMNYLLQQTLPYFAVASGPRTEYVADLMRTLSTPFPALESVIRQTHDTLQAALRSLPADRRGPYGAPDAMELWIAHVRRMVAHLDLVREAVGLARAASSGTEIPSAVTAEWTSRSEALLDAIVAENPAWAAPAITREHLELRDALPGVLDAIRSGRITGVSASAPWHAWLF